MQRLAGEECLAQQFIQCVVAAHVFKKQRRSRQGPKRGKGIEWPPGAGVQPSGAGESWLRVAEHSRQDSDDLN